MSKELAHQVCAAGTAFRKSTPCAESDQKILFPSEQVSLQECIKECGLAHPQSRGWYCGISPSDLDLQCTSTLKVSPE